MFRGYWRGPTDYHRRGNGGDGNGSNGRRVGNVADLASRSGLGIVVVVPQTYRRGKQEEQQSSAGS